MQVISEGSVRVDLVGGTLDLEPINLILPDVVTLNVATSLKARVQLEQIAGPKLEIHSKDYNKKYSYTLEEMTPDKLYYSNYFKEMSFVLQIISEFNLSSGLRIELSSGAPAGSGLGGSSAMGMTLYKALSKLTNTEIDIKKAVLTVKGIEGRILNQGVPGYQDYFPAMLGGILCLKGAPGDIVWEQLYTDELRTFLEEHITLIYSGISRDSGINNWDVYKGFFDHNEQVRAGLGEIARISYKSYQAIKNKDYAELLKLIAQEGESRKLLSPGIVPDEINQFIQEASGLIDGFKMCGAGGGGCFIAIHGKNKSAELQSLISKYQFFKLDFNIESPSL